MHLEDKVALVTGEAQGIGNTCAQVLLEKSCNLAGLILGWSGLEKHSGSKHPGHPQPIQCSLPDGDSHKQGSPRHCDAGASSMALAQCS
ncbi:UNVERIFIED_CONTAM: hypothetical protein K2H54_060584 [Gekko kuhli]